MNMIKLDNGVEMPPAGLGVFQSPPEETAAAVEAALQIGYRHIDTTAACGNEREAGHGLTMVVYDAEPDSRTAGALALLASWSFSAVER